MCVCLCTHVYVCATAFKWKPNFHKHNLWGLVFSFYNVGQKHQTRVIRLCGRRLCLLSHLPGPTRRLLLSFVTFTWSHIKQRYQFNNILVAAMQMFVIEFSGGLAQSVVFILFWGSIGMQFFVQNFGNRFLKVVKTPFM